MKRKLLLFTLSLLMILSNFTYAFANDNTHVHENCTHEHEEEISHKSNEETASATATITTEENITENTVANENSVGASTDKKVNYDFMQNTASRYVVNGKIIYPKEPLQKTRSMSDVCPYNCSHTCTGPDFYTSSVHIDPYGHEDRMGCTYTCSHGYCSSYTLMGYYLDYDPCCDCGNHNSAGTLHQHTEHPHENFYDCFDCGTEVNLGGTNYNPNCTTCNPPPVCTNHTSSSQGTVSSNHTDNGHPIIKVCQNSGCGVQYIDDYAPCYSGCSQCTDSDHNFQNLGDAAALHDFEEDGHAQLKECAECEEQKTEYVLDSTCCKCCGHIEQPGTYSCDSSYTAHTSAGHPVYFYCSRCETNIPTNDTPHFPAACYLCHSSHTYGTTEYTEHTATGSHRVYKECTYTGCSCSYYCGAQSVISTAESDTCLRCSPFVANVDYYFRNLRYPDKYMKRNGSTLVPSIVSEENCVDWDLTELLSNEFKFVFIPYNDGSFVLRHAIKNQDGYLVAYKYVSFDGINLTLSDHITSSARWTLEKSDLGYYRIVSFNYPDYVLSSYQEQISVIDREGTLPPQENQDEWILCKAGNGLSSISLEAQMTNSWCWAASARMMTMALFDTPINQAALAAHMFLLNETNDYIAEDSNHNDVEIPGVYVADKRNLNPTPLQQSASTKGAKVEEIANALDYLVGDQLFEAKVGELYNETVLLGLLKRNMPVLMCSQTRHNSEIVGHAMVIGGFEYEDNDGNNYHDTNEECRYYMYDPDNRYFEGVGTLRKCSYYYLTTGQRIQESDPEPIQYEWVSSVVFKT